jgi:RimJ/RimL family protein N-acetyltransferase
VPWVTVNDPEAFLAAAGAFLRARPVEHTVLLGVVERLVRGGPAAYGPAPPLLAWWEEGGEVRAALLRTPPFPALLTELPEHVVAPAAELLGASGADAPAPTARLLAAAAQARTGAPPRVTRRQRLHRLEELVPPRPAPDGRALAARDEHRALLVAWSTAFAREAGTPPLDVAAQVDDRLRHGGFTLWEREDGQLVSLAGRTPAVAGVARVGPVFTPPEHRGRGYAAGATAAAVLAALDDGAAQVALFTDLANPVSNRLYARLGFRAVEDRVILVLEG